MHAHAARTFTIACLALSGWGCQVTDSDGGAFGDASASDSLDAGGEDGTDDGDGSSGDGDSGDDDGEPRFDLSDGDGDLGGCDGPDGNCGGCDAVDLLFVIDNSGSMGKYQQALGLAFPAFTATLVDALPPGTSVHVGVTSTEMGFSADGDTYYDQGMCTFMGDGGQHEDAFYDTPDNADSGKNGAQGRLYEANGAHYAEFSTDDPQAAIDEVETWFTAAANIGTGGSNIEMLSAPAGWIAHPANDATNAGFIRDAGSVMVVFFMQDEPDQTPLLVGGQPSGPKMLEMLAGAKTQCGGADCIIAGGFLDDEACGGRPIDDFLDALPDAPQIAQLPANDDPQAAADMMNAHLSDTLAGVIAQKCDTIPPAG